MTPKELALDLYRECLEFVHKGDSTVSAENLAKMQARLICDRIHEALKQTFHQVHKKTEMTPDLYLSESIAVHYYQEVKQEIEQL